MIKIIAKEDCETEVWSGGTTTELLIHPANGNFNTGDFLMRVSIAEVNDLNSIYTPFAGVKRILTVLKGQLTLEHEGHHTSELHPFDQDTFSAEWKTISTGQVTNFNVMLKKDQDAIVTPRHLEEGESYNEENSNNVFLYVVKGSCDVNGKNIDSEQGILTDENIELRALTNTTLITVYF